MKLKKLFADLPVQWARGSKEVHITGICSNSKFVVPGNLFIAKKGKTHEGNRFIEEAVRAGASAILTDVFDPFIENCTMIVYSDVNELESVLAHRYYQAPSDELFLVGITGTNGKTTTTYLVRYLLEQLGISCGLMGTIEYLVGKCRYQATHTTTDVISNMKMLREMLVNGCQAAVMEVTSHAIDQKRIAHLDYDIGIFTNLTQDHLDYHHDMESYGKAKQKFFDQVISKKHKGKQKFGSGVIVNQDDPWSQEMVRYAQVPVLTYGISVQADVMATSIEYHLGSTSFDLNFKGSTSRVRIPLMGRFNVYNVLAAMGVGLLMGIPLEKLATIFAHAPQVEGRMEPVKNKKNLPIFVDYSHTEDALRNALKALKPLTKGRLIVVFGCGGNRDVGKRPKMGAVAAKWADLIFVTSDNPRKEDPKTISDQICEGFSSETRYVVELDRKTAIEKAVACATIDDTILIAGKGHEPYQIFAHKTIEFDDRVIAREACDLVVLS